MNSWKLDAKLVGLIRKRSCMFVNMTKPTIPLGPGVLGIPGNLRLPYSACKARIRSSLMMVQKTYRHVPSNLP